MASAKRKENEPTIIKKYANRRLYDTGRSSYVTLEDLCEMVKDGIDFVVKDAKSGDDITRSVLTQIIVEQESKGEGENLLPTGFLKNLIGFYGDNIQSVVPNYLEQTLEAFVKNQEQMREHMNKSFENMKPLNNTMQNPMSGMTNMFTKVPGTENITEMSRKNMEMFEQTMKMFMPFGSDSKSDDK